MDYRERVKATATGATLSLYSSNVDELRERWVNHVTVNRTGSVTSYGQLYINTHGYNHYITTSSSGAGVSKFAIDRPIHLHAGERLGINFVSTTATDIYDISITGFERVTNCEKVYKVEIVKGENKGNK